MADDYLAQCAKHLRHVLDQIKAARPLHIADGAIPFFLTRLNMEDMFQSDLLCQNIYTWPNRTLVSNPPQLLAQASTGAEEQRRQLCAEVVALRIAFAIDACGTDFEELREGVALSGDFRRNINALLIDAWYKHWYSWCFLRFGHKYMPFQMDDEPQEQND